jgi:hypothetical protein
MSENAKNQYRCETCMHHKIVGRIPDIDECDILDHTPTQEEKRFVLKMGCASHSLFTNPSEYLTNLIKHFESMDDHEELYLCDIIALLKGKIKL